MGRRQLNLLGSGLKQMVGCCSLTMVMNIHSHTLGGMSRLATDLSASQRGMCTIELENIQIQKFGY
jgi:hypothetical protein